MVSYIARVKVQFFIVCLFIFYFFTLQVARYINIIFDLCTPSFTVSKTDLYIPQLLLTMPFSFPYVEWSLLCTWESSFQINIYLYNDMHVVPTSNAIFLWLL